MIPQAAAKFPSEHSKPVSEAEGWDLAIRNAKLASKGHDLQIHASNQKASSVPFGCYTDPALGLRTASNGLDADTPLHVARIFGERLQVSTSKQATMEAFQWAAAQLDLPGDVIVAELPSRREDFTAFVKMHQWGGAWFLRYLRLNYVHNDPILTHVRVSWDGFLWKDILARTSLNQQEREIMSEAQRAGIANGYTVPLHGPNMRTAFVSFATRVDSLDLSMRDTLSLIARRLDGWFRTHEQRDREKLASLKPERPLSPQELECVYWTMEGHVSKEIAYSTGLSARTVDQYIRSAVEKLGARNRIDAAFKAVRLGLIRKA